MRTSIMLGLCAERGSRRTRLAELPRPVQVEPMSRCVSVLLTWIRLAIMVIGMVQLAAVPAALPADLTRATLHVVVQSQTALLSGNRPVQFANLSAPSTASSAIPKLYGPQPEPGLPGTENSVCLAECRPAPPGLAAARASAGAAGLSGAAGSRAPGALVDVTSSCA